MANTYRNFDSSKRAQKVLITWEMVTAADDSADSPDDRQDGFWPSRNTKDAGYVPPENFDKAQEIAEETMRAFKAGEWSYIGVIARAHIAVPIGGTSFATYTMDSPGLWGIESNSGDYLKEVFQDEKAELLAHLKTLGNSIVAETYLEVMP